eukprot:scaffold79331_cov42-Attheya_sp.AAC.2
MEGRQGTRRGSSSSTMLRMVVGLLVGMMMLVRWEGVNGFQSPAGAFVPRSLRSVTHLKVAAAASSSEKGEQKQVAAFTKEELEYDASRIRNFSIIAHIDHGKSTLADRLLERTQTVSSRDMSGKSQIMDTMDLEQERGITIKLQAARVLHRSTKDGKLYSLNLIDTPGHVDFSYEVSRSLAACEGALLVVDASQGIEAQTLANVYLALDNDLEIIPVLNKIDLPAADPDRVKAEIEETIGLDCSNIVKASAKSGIGIDEIMESIIELVPPPKGNTGEPFRALIFDSLFDAYRGVIVFFRVVDGQVKKGDKVRFLASMAEHEVTEVGILTPNQNPVPSLQAGEVGYLCGSIKDVLDARVGDTMTLSTEYKAAAAALAKSDPNSNAFPIEPLPGYAASVPM